MPTRGAKVLRADAEDTVEAVPEVDPDADADVDADVDVHVNEFSGRCCADVSDAWNTSRDRGG